MLREKIDTQLEEILNAIKKMSLIRKDRDRLRAENVELRNEIDKLNEIISDLQTGYAEGL